MADLPHLHSCRAKKREQPGGWDQVRESEGPSDCAPLEVTYRRVGPAHFIQVLQEDFKRSAGYSSKRIMNIYIILESFNLFGIGALLISYFTYLILLSALQAPLFLGISYYMSKCKWAGGSSPLNKGNFPTPLPTHPSLTYLESPCNGKWQNWRIFWNMVSITTNL